MTRPDKNEKREERIHMEIIVDAYGPEEQAMSWYNYLSDTLQFPFSARCIVRRTTSPLELGEEVKVVAMAPDEACEHDMLVSIQWNRRQVHLVIALRTPCPPHILVRIEKEAVTRGLFAKLCRGFLLLVDHSFSSLSLVARSKRAGLQSLC